MKDGPEQRFVLPDGYVDPSGRRHRQGAMRCARARDEIQVLGDFRVHLRPESFLPVMLARVVTRLGTLDRVDVGAIEKLSERDRGMLEDLYRDQNGYGHHDQ